jgi:hypothetical protein
LRLFSGERARCLPPTRIALWLLRARPAGCRIDQPPSPLISTVVSASDVADRSAQAAPQESLKEHSPHDRP